MGYLDHPAWLGVFAENERIEKMCAEAERIEKMCAESDSFQKMVRDLQRIAEADAAHAREIAAFRDAAEQLGRAQSWPLFGDHARLCGSVASSIAQDLYENDRRVRDMVEKLQEDARRVADMATLAQDHLGAGWFKAEAPWDDWKLRLAHIEPVEDVLRRVVRQEIERAIAEATEASEPPSPDEDPLYGADGVKRKPGFKVSDDED